MKFEHNTYYNLSSFGKEAIAQALLLLKSYPLTQFLLKLLGKKLIFSLQCGLFTSDYKIIEQAEKGKDLFLLCKGNVDVIVNGQLITQMSSPSLVGDKGIITKKAVRAATISVSEHNICLFIKIPMDNFLRDYMDTSIEDSAFLQEQKIYNNIFQEIQNRLFKFSHLQKKLWSEVSKSLNDLNTKLVSNSIEKNKSEDWDASIWNLLKQYVKTQYHLEITEKTLDIKTFNRHLLSQLKKNYPPNAFGCSGNKHQRLLKLIYIKWITNISRFLIQHLPKEQLPINVGELNVINPRNYRDKLQLFFNTIEKKFVVQDIWNKNTTQKTDALKIHNFFGREIDSNSFNLPKYLETFESIFDLKKPKRVLAQLAEETARIAAALENEFNASVSQMQQFLQKVQTLASQGQKGDQPPSFQAETLEYLEELSQATELYQNKIWGGLRGSFGQELKFNEKDAPTLQKLLHAHASPQLKKKVQKAFFGLIKTHQAAIKGVSKEQLQSFFSICMAQPGQFINYQHFYSHFWIPIGEDICLQQGLSNTIPLKPGTVWGGDLWKSVRSLNEQQSMGSGPEPDGITLKASEINPKKKGKQIPAFLVLPDQKVPWYTNKSPDPKHFNQHYLPLMQWFIDQYLKNIHASYGTYKDLSQKWESIVKTIIIEEKVRKFETGKNSLPENLYKKILSLIEKTLGIKLEGKTAISPEQLSRQLYNEIRKNTKKFHQHLNYEEQNNKTYSLWRYMQGEIISKFSSNEIHKKANIDPLPPVFVELRDDLTELFKSQGIKTTEKTFSLEPEVPVLDLAEIFKEKALLSEEEKIELFLEIFSIIELEVFNIYHNSFDYQKRLSEFSEMKVKIDMKELKTEYIEESAEILISLIQSATTGKKK